MVPINKFDLAKKRGNTNEQFSIFENEITWYLRKVRVFMICDYNDDGDDDVRNADKDGHGDDDDQDDYDDVDDDVDILEQLSWQWALVSAKGSNTKNI